MISRAIGSTKSAAMSPCSTPDDDLLERDELHRDGREQPILDLARPAEVATIGSATDCTLEKARLTARTPGRSAALYASLM